MTSVSGLAGLFRRLQQWFSDLPTAVGDFLFGYDFFISYSHRDGTAYPTRLREQLEALGYRVFHDVRDYAGGDDLRTGTRRRLRMSKKLVLLARRVALSDSHWVYLELQQFIALGRSPIVIEFQDAPVSSIPAEYPLRDLLNNRVSIREPQLESDGSPAESVIQKLVGSFDATRQEVIRQRALWATALLFLVIAGLASWQWDEAVQERRVAESQRADARTASHFSDAGRLAAEWDLDDSRRADLHLEIERVTQNAENATPDATKIRVASLESQILEVEASLRGLADNARRARAKGHEELRLADAAWSRAREGRRAGRDRPEVPRIFSIEVLSVGFGESLILHYGDPDAPRFILIDGGQPRTFEATLKPRLEALRKRWSPQGSLPIEYIMVSNQDNDRLGGLQRLFGDLVHQKESGVASPYAIKNVWFGSFAPPYPMWQKAITRQHIDQLGIPLNKPFDHLVMRRPTGRTVVDLGDCLTATILGPDKVPLAKLHEDWAAQARKHKMEPPVFPSEQFSALGSPRACDAGRKSLPTRPRPPPSPPIDEKLCPDRSVPNRASQIILFEFAELRFLHPGDSCAEQVEAGLRAAGLAEADGSFRVDVLLVPHLGSDRNVNPGFFKRVKARQYLFTGNGKYGPDDKTLQMLLDARADDAKNRDKYYFQFLNRDGESDFGTRLDVFFSTRSSDDYGYRRVFRSSRQKAITVDLLERVRY